MRRHLQAGVIGLVLGLLLAGGVAVAGVVGSESGSSDRYFACVSADGEVRSGTIRLNTEPSRCRRADDTIHSWNAEGPPGPAGESAIAEVVTVPVTERLEMDSASSPGGPLVWEPLAPQSTVVETIEAESRLRVSWWAATACFGGNRKYARIVVDGVIVGGAPLTNPIGHLEDFPGIATEASVTIEGVADVGPGTHTVVVETAFDSASSCVIAPPSGGGGGLLTVEVLE
jgi:hypothetical protein